MKNLRQLLVFLLVFLWSVPVIDWYAGPVFHEIVPEAAAQTGCSSLSQTTLLNEFADNQPAGSIVPAFVRNVICSVSNLLANTGVTPGTYTNPNLTVGADGRVTSAANGSANVINYPAVAHQWINGINQGTPTSTQPACGDISNAAASCSTDATNASNIGSGTLNNNRLAATVAQTNVANPFTAGQSNTPGTLTFGATVTPNFAAANVFILTLTGNVSTFANPTNLVAGQCGAIYLVQDATGSRLISSFGADWKFPGGTAPTLSTAANAVDIMSYCSRSTSEVDANLLQNFK